MPFFLLHISLLFAGLLSGLGPQEPGAGEARGFIQPTGEGGPLTQARGFSGKNNEDRLGHVLRILGIADVSQGD